MIKRNFVTLVWLTTVVSVSVFSRVGADPLTGDCLVTKTVNCCDITPGFCEEFFGCGECCGQVWGHNDSLLTLAPSSSGWSEESAFGVDTSGPHCDYYAPTCVGVTTCDVLQTPLTTYCIGYLDPGGRHDCP